MRGVHDIDDTTAHKDRGSSPHARGPRFSDTSMTPVSGIIPACAGSTLFLPLWHLGCQDHPRMRGVHFCRLEVGDLVTGSSPHARGPH